MALVQAYSCPLINATPKDAFYRYAYGSLRIIYLGPSGRQRKRGCICLPLSHYARRAVIIFLEPGAKNMERSLPHQSQEASSPVIPGLSAEVVHILSRFGFKISTS